MSVKIVTMVASIQVWQLVVQKIASVMKIEQTVGSADNAMAAVAVEAVAVAVATASTAAEATTEITEATAETAAVAVAEAANAAVAAAGAAATRAVEAIAAVIAAAKRLAKGTAKGGEGAQAKDPVKRMQCMLSVTIYLQVCAVCNKRVERVSSVVCTSALTSRK